MPDKDLSLIEGTIDLSVMFKDSLKFEVKVYTHLLSNMKNYALYRQNFAILEYAAKKGEILCERDDGYSEEDDTSFVFIRCSKDPEDLKNGWINMGEKREQKEDMKSRKILLDRGEEEINSERVIEHNA